MIEPIHPNPGTAAGISMWPMRAVSATSDLAQALRELAALQDRYAQLEALNASLARSLQIAQESKASLLEDVVYAALGTTDPEAVKVALTPRFTRHSEVLAVPAAAPVAAPPSSVARLYRPKCRTCDEKFDSQDQYAKKCPACREAGIVKPARPIGPIPSGKAKPSKATKPAKAKAPAPPPAKDVPPTPPELSDAPPPITKAPKGLACAECKNGKSNPHSDTGWECTIARVRDCMPWTFAHLKNFTPKTSQETK